MVPTTANIPFPGTTVSYSQNETFTPEVLHSTRAHSTSAAHQKISFSPVQRALVYATHVDFTTCSIGNALEKILSMKNISGRWMQCQLQLTSLIIQNTKGPFHQLIGEGV